MATPIDPALRQALAERLRFYRDLGLTDLYRKPVDPVLLTPPETAEAAGLAPLPQIEMPAAVERRAETAPAVQPAPAEAPPQANSFEEDPAIPARKTTFFAPPPAGEAVPAAGRAAALQLIRDEIGDCTR